MCFLILKEVLHLVSIVFFLKDCLVGIEWNRIDTILTDSL